MNGKLTIVIEDDGMDDGCRYDIYQACRNHGKILSARCTGTVEQGPDAGQEYDHDLMFEVEHIEPEAGKC
jgi:hypothetical protein